MYGHGAALYASIRAVLYTVTAYSCTLTVLELPPGTMCTWVTGAITPGEHNWQDQAYWLAEQKDQKVSLNSALQSLNLLSEAQPSRS